VRLWLGVLLAAVAGAAAAGEPPHASVTRLPDGVAAPKLDGVLDDPAWALATPIGRETALGKVVWPFRF